jgi:hypothetical protein
MKKVVALLIAAVVLGTAGVASAQVRATGIIEGTVLDPEGVALPGAQVTVSGTGAIADQTVYTGPAGHYRVTLLPPGLYTVTVSLQGFATQVQEEVDVGVRRTTSVNFTLTLSALEETVTVTGTAPVVDVRNTKRSTEVSDEVMNTLPEPRGVGGDLMNLSLDASIPAGGQVGYNGSNGASFFGGTTASNSFQVDGVTVTDPSGGSQFPFYSPDWFEVVEQTTTGAGADMGKGSGSIFNVVTKSGGNDFTGESNFFFQNSSFINYNGDNIESDLVDFGPENAADIDHRYDFSFNVGGPVIRDKLWFFAGYQLFDEKFTDPGVPFDATENSDRFFGKLTLQQNADNRFIVSVMADTYTLGGRPSDPLTTEDATVEEPSMNITPNVTWNTILGPNSFLEVKYSGFYGYFDLIPISEAPAQFDLGTGVLSDAYWGYYTFDRARSNVQGNLSYFAEDYAGDHSIRVGAEWERLLTDDRAEYGPNAAGENWLYYPYFGEPYLGYQLDPDQERNTSLIYATTLYAQDDWTIANRLTLNLGVRFDHWSVGWLDATRSDAPSFNDVSPRIGANFDVFGDGRTAAYFSFGRYYEEVHGTIFDNFDPNQSADIAYEWDGTEFVEFGRFGATGDLAISSDLSNQWSDQLTVGMDQQILDDLSISARYIRKYDSDIIGGEDTGSTFVPIQLLASNGALIDMWAADPRDDFTTLVNNPNASFLADGELFREYNGFQIKMIKRYADNWTIQSSYILQKAEGNVTNTGTGVNGSTSAFFTPNRFVNTPGELPNSRRHVFKLNGSYLFADPIGVLVGVRFDITSGNTDSMYERFSSGETGGLASGDRTVPIEQYGSYRLETYRNLDLRLEKRFSLAGPYGDLGVVFDVFNLTNEDTVIDIFNRVPDFGQITGIVNPRTFRIGARWLF